MKKGMAVLSAFMIGTNSVMSGVVVMAAQNESEVVEPNSSKESLIQERFFSDTENDFVKGSLELFDIEGKEFLKQNPDLFDLGKEKTKGSLEFKEGEEDKILEEAVLKEDEKTGMESKDSDKRLLKDTDKKEAEEAEVQKPAGMKNLQIPQKLEVVLDPWELERKGQIYSEEYVIQNTGDNAGVLSLSHLACKPQAQSGVVVKTDKTGLHDNEEKSVYMEMVFGNGEQIVLAEESSKYEVELQPGEILSLCFTGEMNEYASQGWDNGDVRVEVVYSWSIVEDENGVNRDDVGSGADKTDEENESNTVDAQEEALPNNMELDDPIVPENSIGIEGNLTAEEPKIGEENEPQINVDNHEFEGDELGGEKEPKVIDLKEFQTAQVVIDSWRIEENGQILSKRYTVRNTGERAGTLTLSKLVCCAGEESEILVKREKKELEEAEERAVYMEMVLGNGERFVLSRKEADYKLELRPGEEISVYFEGKINGNGTGSMEQGEVVVSALCSWNVKETAAEQSPSMDAGLIDQKEDEEEYN